jgi:acyl-coenzyme A thioesterase PaaI-like protein
MARKKPGTLHRIEQTLCGDPLELPLGWAVVRLVATPAMATDARGLMHCGFMFGLADYATRLAVNDPSKGGAHTGGQDGFLIASYGLCHHGTDGFGGLGTTEWRTSLSPIHKTERSFKPTK